MPLPLTLAFNYFRSTQTDEVKDHFLPTIKTSMHVVFRFWPGFEKLWNRGDFHSLLVSILFSWAVMLAWSATFVWPEWLQSTLENTWLARGLLTLAWIALFFSAAGSAVQSLRFSNKDTNHSPAFAVKQLELAQEFYLQADYFEAERLLKKNVRQSNVDIESSVLLVAILRRTRRLPQALELIASLERLEASLPWLSEIRVEKEHCLRLKIQTPPAHD